MTNGTNPPSRGAGDRLIDLAMIHGGDLLRWPDPARREARALLDAAPDLEPEFNRALADSLAVDAALSAEALEGAHVSDALMGRILDGAAPVAASSPRPVQRATGRRMAARLAPPLALAASALMGVFLGTNLPGDVAETAFGVVGLDAGQGEDGDPFDDIETLFEGRI